MWRLVVLSLALFPFVATCQPIVDNPILDRENPTAGQPVNVDLHGGACVLYDFEPGPPSSVQRNGSAVVLTVEAIVGPSGFCVYPIDATYKFPIGSYGPGSYIIEVNAHYQLFTGEYVTQALGVLSFTVPGLSPLPTLSTLSLAVLGLALLVAGCTKTRLTIRSSGPPVSVLR